MSISTGVVQGKNEEVDCGERRFPRATPRRLPAESGDTDIYLDNVVQCGFDMSPDCEVHVLSMRH